MNIIPNAIGGRLKSKELLCKKCNSILGEKFDSKFCNSLSPLSGFYRKELESDKAHKKAIKEKITQQERKYYFLLRNYRVACYF